MTIHGDLALHQVEAVASEPCALALCCGIRVFSADAKVRVLASGLATYPEASVVCGAIVRHPEDDNALTNPALLVEVWSVGTEKYDRGEKADHDRKIPSRKDNVLVSRRTPRIEIHSREGDHRVLRVAGPGESVPLTAMPGALSVDRVFEGAELTQVPSRPGRSPRGG